MEPVQGGIVDQRQNRAMWWLACLLGISGLACFHWYGNATKGYIDTGSMFVWWVSQWFNEGSDLEHSPLLTFVAGGIFIYNWKRFGHLSRKTLEMMGSGFLVAGIFGNITGLFLQQTRFSIFGFLIYLCGLAALMGGRRGFSAIQFPLLLMLFTLPWGFLTDEFGFYLRLGVIHLSGEIANLAGIGIERSGTLLEATDGSFAYDVAPACSGMRSLLILSALSLIVGYLSFGSWWRRGLLLFLTFPYAFAGNVLRISAILFAANWFGEGAGMVVHEWFGFLVFIVVLGLALLSVSAIQRWFPEKQQGTVPFEAETPCVASVKGKSNWRMPAVLVFLGSVLILNVLFATRFENRRDDYQSGIHLNGEGDRPRPLPPKVGKGWLGETRTVTKAERAALPEDTGFARKLYQNWRGEPILLSIVLSGTDRSSIHRPEICLTAQGFRILEGETHSLGLDSGEIIPVTILDIGKQMKNSENAEGPWSGLFIYWFVGGESMVATENERMLTDYWDRLRGKPSRWAYVMIQTPLYPDRERALQRVQEFVSEALNEFQEEGLKVGVFP